MTPRPGRSTDVDARPGTVCRAHDAQTLVLPAVRWSAYLNSRMSSALAQCSAKYCNNFQQPSLAVSYTPTSLLLGDNLPIAKQFTVAAEKSYRPNHTVRAPSVAGQVRSEHHISVIGYSTRVNLLN